MSPRTSGTQQAGRSRLALVVAGAAVLAASGLALTAVVLRTSPQAPALPPRERLPPPRPFLGEPPAPPLPPTLPAGAGAAGATAASVPPPAAFHGAAPPRAPSRFHGLTDEALGELARGVEEAEARVELLRELGRRRAGLLTLLAFLDDASGPVRMAAAEGLRRLGDPRAADRLRDRAARERDPSVRTTMVEAAAGLARVAVSPH